METRIQDPHSDLVYRVEMGREGMTGGGGGDAKRGRKKRSDAGKPRKDSDWIRLVAEYEDVPYNKALKIASQYKKDGYTYRDFE